MNLYSHKIIFWDYNEILTLILPGQLLQLSKISSIIITFSRALSSRYLTVL